MNPIEVVVWSACEIKTPEKENEYGRDLFLIWILFLFHDDPKIGSRYLGPSRL